jgi:hypothetical protein
LGHSLTRLSLCLRFSASSLFQNDSGWGFAHGKDGDDSFGRGGVGCCAPYHYMVLMTTALKTCIAATVDELTLLFIFLFVITWCPNWVFTGFAYWRRLR